MFIVSGVPMAAYGRFKSAIRDWAPVQGSALSWTFPILAVPFVWRQSIAGPTSGLDPSSLIAFQEAFRHGLTLSRSLSFTYGPLGFLSPALFYETGPWLLALGYTVLLLFVAAWCSLRLWASRIVGPSAYAAATATVVVASALSLPWMGPELALFVGFVFLLVVLEDMADGDHVIAAAALSGLLTGVNLIAKFSVGGLLLGAFVVAYLLCGERLARLLVPFFASVAAPVLIVLLPGGWAAVTHFFRSSTEMSIGYSQSFGLEQAGRFWELPAAVVVIAGLGALVWLATTSWPTRGRVAALASETVLAAGLFKEGFIRHDGHAVIFFFAMATLALALPWNARRTTKALTSLVVAMALIESGYGHAQLVADPGQAARAFGGQLHALFSASARRNLADSLRAQSRQDLDISPEIISLLHGTVHIDPSEASVAWAYPSLRWSPLPVFQAYAVDTPWLDEQNAERLNSADAPSAILRQQPGTIDGRYPFFDSPAAQLMMLCRYREAKWTRAWEVLLRSRSRCGRLTRVGSLDARLDQTIVVPRTPPGVIELARVSFRTSVIERLETELYKAPETYVILSGSSRYRFMTSVSPDGLPLSVPPDVNYHAQWRIPQVVSLRFSRTGWPGVGQIHVDFETVKVRAS